MFNVLVQEKMRDRGGGSERWPGYVISTKVIFNPAEAPFFWRKSVFRDVRTQSSLALRFLVKRENGGARGRLMNIYIHHVFSKGNSIYRRLDFGFNVNNGPIPSTSSGTTLGFGEKQPSSGIVKPTIEAHFLLVGVKGL